MGGGSTEVPCWYAYMGGRWVVDNMGTLQEIMGWWLIKIWKAGNLGGG